MRKGHPRGSETWEDIPNAPSGFGIINLNAQLGENDHKLVQANMPLDEEMLVRNTYVNA